MSEFFPFVAGASYIPNSLYRLQPVAALGVCVQAFQELEERFVVGAGLGTL
jgi:hypothetical protein